MSIINGGSTLGFFGGSTPYEISRSLRFNSADSAYLSRTPASAGNRKTWTWAGWVKRSSLGTEQTLFCSTDLTANTTYLGYNATTNCLDFYQNTSSAIVARKTTTAVFRDSGAWMHVCAIWDTTNSTATDRMRLYVNGSRITVFNTTTDPASSTDSRVNSTLEHNIGRAGASTYHLDAYLADIHFIDGQALDPTSFGEFSATTGVWMPKKYTGTYGTNGFHLDFSDNSAATATTLGKDSSGNGNNWTPNNLSVTAGAGNDSLVDVPVNGTQTDTGAGGEVRGNYCTWNPLDLVSTTLANGNLQASGSTDVAGVSGTIGVSSGKWYWEVTAGSTYDVIGIWSTTSRVTSYPGDTSSSYGYFGSTGNKINSGAGSAYGATFTTNDVIGVALDLDAGTLTFYKNGVSQSTAFSSLAGGFRPAVRAGSASGASTATYLNAGARPFAYTAPSGFKALNTSSLPAPVVTKPSTVFDTYLWSGNGGTQTIFTSFSPDFVWVKQRDNTNVASHVLVDIVRGNNNVLRTNGTDAENAAGIDPALYDGVTNLSTASFDVVKGSSGTYNGTNGSGKSYVGWAWDAGSSTVTNPAGTISSQVRANTSAGFSIVTYTGNGTNGATVGHGLGVAPSFVIWKRRDTASNWLSYHVSLGNNQYFYLSSTAAAATASGIFGFSSATATLQNYTDYNASSGTYVAYCFAPVAGYSAFGSYTGNGNSDGPFVYTGHRSRWIMIKASSGTSAGSANWMIIDTARDAYNLSVYKLAPNLSDAENSINIGNTTQNTMDILSNGFKLRSTTASTNESGTTYVWASFAENPFSLARAR
jgi:hypothetical protein